MCSVSFHAEFLDSISLSAVPNCTKDQRNSAQTRTESSQFLAHLSRRLMGELIVYQSLRRPSVVRRLSSVVRPSTISNIFSSETNGPIELKFHMETP